MDAESVTGLENSWLLSNNPFRLQRILNGLRSTSRRKLRLAAVACCRRVWGKLTRGHRQFIEISEQFADGKAKFSEMRAARELAPFATDRQTAKKFDTGYRDPAKSLDLVLANLIGFATYGETIERGEFTVGCFARFKKCEFEELVTICALLHDIFGNPFRPVALDPRWLTSTVIDLAQAIYDERAFDRMPILADALTDAGCDSDEIIAHCRGDGPHVRGCWVVDLILGKE